MNAKTIIRKSQTYTLTKKLRFYVHNVLHLLIFLEVTPISTADLRSWVSLAAPVEVLKFNSYCKKVGDILNFKY